jgi:predicted MPP superfamily phosphohydrolase
MAPIIRVLSSVLIIASVVAGVSAPALARRREETQTLKGMALLTSLAFLLFFLSDWMLLWALPRLKLSFAPTLGVPLLASLLVRLTIFWALLGVLVLMGRRRSQDSRLSRPWRATILFLVANLGFSAVQLDAYVLEPLLVETTELSLVFADLGSTAPPLRLVHLTDIHIERSSFREQAVIQKVNALQPDIIVLTGDYLNLSYFSDPTAAAHFRQFVGRLQAPYGIYAVRGSVEPTPEVMERLVEGTDIVWLEQEAVTVQVRGQRVIMIGVACCHQPEVDAERLARTLAGIPAEAFTVLAYHSPDLIREATDHQVDLYLGGHTHGGQIRLPLLGAIVTFSRYGRQYASGLFQEGDTTMIISRGLGFEGGGMPRVRLLCRPEIVSVDLEGENR